MANPLDLEQFRRDASQLFAKLESDLFSVTDSAKLLAERMKDVTLETRKGFENTTSVKNSLSETLSLASRLGTEYIKQERVTEKIQKNQDALTFIGQKLAAETANYVAQMNAASKATRSIADIEADINTALNDSDRNRRKAALSRITTEERRIYLLTKQIETLNEEKKVLDEVNDNLEDGNTIVKNTAARASALAKVFDQISRIPYLKNFMDFKKVADEFDKGFRPGLASLGSELKKAFTNPLFLGLLAITGIIAGIKAMIKLTFEYDKIITDVANNLGESVESSRSLVDNFREISNEGNKVVGALDSAFLSVKNQAAALLELQDTLQTNALFSNQMIQNEILLTKQMKLSKEEAAGIQKFSLLTGKSAESILDNAIAQNKTAISYKKIISDISKVNGEISVMYKNNPELIARAVIEANKLGVSLEQTQRISKSLLDFETSIGAELEAELLTGKRFNFEKARALALDGKSVEATKELLDQMGGLEGLTKLNVIQRERLANAIGMSADELTTAAREQAILNRLGFENKKALEERYEALRRNNDQAGIAALQAEAAKKEGGELLLKDIARANLQDRFNESVERLKQLFTETLSGPLTGILNGMVKFLSNTTALKAVFSALLGLATGIAVAITIASGGANALAAAGIAAATGLGTYAMISSGSEEKDNRPLTPNIVKSQAPETPAAKQTTLEESDLAKRAAAMPVKDAVLAPSDNNYIQTNNKVAKADKKDFVITTPDLGGLSRIKKEDDDKRFGRMEQVINRMASSKIEGVASQIEIPKLEIVAPVQAVNPNTETKLPDQYAPVPRTDMASQAENRRDNRRNNESDNSDRKEVVENRIVLTLDTIPVAVAQNKVHYPRFS